MRVKYLIPYEHEIISSIRSQGDFFNRYVTFTIYVKKMVDMMDKVQNRMTNASSRLYPFIPF